VLARELEERRQVVGPPHQPRRRVGEIAGQARQPLALSLQRTGIRDDDAVG